MLLRGAKWTCMLRQMTIWQAEKKRKVDQEFLMTDSLAVTVVIRSHERAEQAMKTMLLLRGLGVDKIQVYVEPKQVAGISAAMLK